MAVGEARSVNGGAVQGHRHARHPQIQQWWFERSRFELVRETIDIAMDAPIAEEEAKVILLAVQRQRQGMPSGRKQKQAEL